MNDIRRTLLWVAFTMSLLMLWDRWHVFNGEPSMFAPRPAQVAKTGKPGATVTANAASSGIPGAALAASGAQLAQGAASAPEPVPEKVTISTDVVRATLDTRGGDLVDLDLLKYQQNDSHSELLAIAKKAIGMHVDPAPEGNVQVFDTNAEQVYVAQTGLMPDKDGRNLPYHRTVMHLVSGDRKLADGKNELALRFESPEVNGVQLVKTYTFHRGSYAVDVTHEVVNRSSAPVSPQLYLQLVRDGRTPAGGYFSGPSSYTGPAVYRDGKFNKVSFTDIEKGKEKDTIDPTANATDGWIAMIQHYFSSVWILPAGSARTYSLAHLPADVNGQPTYRVAMLTPVGTIAPGASQKVSATLFAGPQEEHLLEPLAPGLEQVKDYGVFKIIAQPLFWLLDKLHTVIGNWGWSIVALVVVLKAAFYGLNASAYRSMAKMKAVAPRITELRERYKDNPQQMQAETMKIYREEKVNPLGGCLPILIQMPIFFALFTVLTSSAEMRGAPWILWIHDLSIMDPYAILPVLMTLSSLAMTALNPTPADPMQAKMMWMMPLAFSVALFAFPSGLVLYWLTNNLLTIAQQRMIMRQIEGPKGKATEARIVKAK
jgi:YidC/Oxa1 family membrane protein insertase